VRLLRQIWTILKIGLSNEWADKERIISPVLFALVFVLMLWFSFGELPPSLGVRIFVAEVFLAMFFAVQVAFMRIFEPELEDEAMLLYRNARVHPVAIYLGKLLHTIVVAVILTLSALFIGQLFLNQSQDALTNATFLITMAAVIFGLSSLGVLLSGLTARIRSKQILFPVLFFGLTVPVMILGVQASILALEDAKDVSALISSWLGLLIVADLLYFTVGIIVFDQLMRPE